MIKSQISILKQLTVLIMGTFLFLLSSCESEETIIENRIPSAEKKTITFSNLKSIVTQDNARGGKLNLLLDKASNHNSNTSSRFEGDSFIKYIDSTEVLQMLKNGITTFTLRVETKDTDIKNFYNVLIYLKDGQWTYDYLKYTPEITKQGMEAVLDGKMFFIDENGVELHELNRIANYTICGYQVIPVYLCSHGNNHGPDDPQCTVHDGQVIAYEYYPVYCTDFGGGSTIYAGIASNTSTNTNTNPTPSGGSYSSSNNPNPVGVLIPTSFNTIKTPTQIKLEFEATLTATQIAWLNNPLNNDLEYEIIKYLTDNQTITDVETANPTFVFAEEMLEQIMLNPTLFTSIKPFLIEKQIDDSELDPCSKAVLNAIRNSQNNDVATIIAKLDSSPSVYKTKIINEILGSVYGTLGLTNWTGAINGGGNYTKYDYSIKINSNLVNQGTKLKIYATTLHELIHAYFLSLIDDCHIGSNCDLLQTYPELWNFYKECNSYGIITDPISQHNQLALSYVNIIAEALEEYQPGLASQYYRDLAWGGLHGTIPYENNNPTTRLLTDDDRNRVQLVGQAESSNLPQQQYSIMGVLITTHNPNGIPCN